MAAQVTTALIAGFVAVVVAVGGGVVTWAQIRRERERWLADIQVAWALELRRARLATYPAAFEAIAPLSTHRRSTLTGEVAAEVAEKLNTWLYSMGGMCADATTRGAVLGLRDSCSKWATVGDTRPPQLYEFRNLTITFLRRDLDLTGPESYDFPRNVTMLNKLRDDLDALDKRSRT